MNAFSLRNTLTQPTAESFATRLRQIVNTRQADKKEEIKQFIFADDIMVYVGNSKDSTKMMIIMSSAKLQDTSPTLESQLYVSIC